MTNQRPTPPRRSGKPNTQAIKILITTASLTAIVGGWALFTQQSAWGSQETAAADPVEAQMVDPLPPLPTLVPEPAMVAAPVNAPIAAGPLPNTALTLPPAGPTPLPTAGPLPKVSSPKDTTDNKSAKPAKQKNPKPAKSGNSGSSKP